MTSKQFYKRTSDMAYLVKDADCDFDRNDNPSFTGVVFLKDGESPEKILKENDFFAIMDCDAAEEDFENVKTINFELTFIAKDGKEYTYSMDVCDVIDCRIGGGELVLSCNGYELIDTFVPKKEEETKKEECKCGNNGGCKCAHQVTIPSPRALFGVDSYFPGLPAFTEFPKFPDFSDVFKDMDKKFDEMKENGTKFCEVSYSMDGNGNGHYRKATNDGVVEKHFKKVDGQIKEIDAPETVKVEVKDENAAKKSGINTKTELKDLLK